MSPKKILTRLELGRLEIAHRAVLAFAEEAPEFDFQGTETDTVSAMDSLSGIYRRLATPGGLVITAPIEMSLQGEATAAERDAFPGQGCGVGMAGRDQRGPRARRAAGGTASLSERASATLRLIIRTVAVNRLD